MTRSRVVAAILSLFSSFLIGCVGSGPLLTLPRSASGEAPWRLPAESHPTQRLFRAHYQGPEGEGDIRLTLYLASPTSFRIQASGGLPSRRFWELAVAESRETIWLDHREKTVCRTADAMALRVPALADLPVGSLPKVLLGRVPGTPSTRVSRSEGSFSYSDARGRRWDGAEELGRVTWWAMIEDGATSVWWRAQPDGSSILVDQVAGHELRWKETVRENLSDPRVDLVIPEGFSASDCGLAEPAS